MHTLGLSRQRHLRGVLDHLARVGGHGHLAVAHDQLSFCSSFVDQFHQLLAGDLLLLQEKLGKLIKEIHVVSQELHATLILLVHDALDLSVHLLLQSLRHGRSPLSHEVTAHEGTAALLASQETLANFRRHAKGHHHLLGDLRALLEVVGGTSGHIVLAVDDLFGQAPTQRHAHAILQKLLRVEARVQPILGRHEDRHATGWAPRHDADLGHDVVVVHQSAQDGMTGLMIGHELLLLLGHDCVFLLQANRNTLQCIEDVVGVDLRLVLPRRDDGALVQQVCKVCAGHAWGLPCDGREVDAGGQVLALRVDLQDLRSPLNIRRIHLDLTIESPRTDEGLV